VTASVYVESIVRASAGGRKLQKRAHDIIQLSGPIPNRNIHRVRRRRKYIFLL